MHPEKKKDYDANSSGSGDESDDIWPLRTRQNNPQQGLKHTDRYNQPVE